MNTLNSFLLTAMAGASTMLGTVFIFMNKKDAIIGKALAFASGVMLTVSLIDLIPESLKYLNTTFRAPAFMLMLIFLNIGIIISCLVDEYIPSNTDGLYRVGIISMLAIILHNIPEGCVQYVSH